ncbi:hypothetical protein FNX44_026765 [Streptomyces sp. OF1]|uniref:Uncharacterized protein n=2 Tax=Streptomyces alkaliterrae TaxID=2213162 RepID=A0A5P0YZA4_9ACTN|nr:hypothetical protein [Streptomyces alkaliterrae]MQS05370.1 hypothetical protein [Streptomyces alkaliterrae]
MFIRDSSDGGTTPPELEARLTAFVAAATEREVHARTLDRLTGTHTTAAEAATHETGQNSHM